MGCAVRVSLAGGNKVSSNKSVGEKRMKWLFCSSISLCTKCQVSLPYDDRGVEVLEY